MTILERGIAALLLCVGLDLELAAADVAGARDGAALAELPFFADIDQCDAAPIEQLFGLAR